LVVIKLKTSAQHAFPDTYSTIEEFYNDINTFEELSFEYCGQKYIVTYYDANLSVAEFNKPDSTQQFKSPEDFAKNFCIADTCFQDFITKISVLVR